MSLQIPGVRLVRVGPTVVVGGVLGFGAGQGRNVIWVVRKLHHCQSTAVLLTSSKGPLCFLNYRLSGQNCPLLLKPGFKCRAHIIFVRQSNFRGLFQKSGLLNSWDWRLPLLILVIPGIISAGWVDPVRIVNVGSVITTSTSDISGELYKYQPTTFSNLESSSTELI